MVSRQESGPQHRPHAERGRRARVVAFVALAYALTWLVWAPLTLHALGHWDGPAPPWLHFLGSLGPAAAAFIVAASEGKSSFRELGRRCFRAPPRWVLLAVFLPTFLFVASVLVLTAAGSPIDARAIGRSVEFPEMGTGSYAISNLLFYGFGEEVGWRGYLLPRLDGGPASKRAVLIVATVWAVWHLPLFAFSAGMSSMGVAGAAGWLASIVSGSLLTAELFAASGSILVLALFHGSLDVWINSPVGGPVQSAMGALVTIAGFTAPLWVRWYGRGEQPDAPVAG